MADIDDEDDWLPPDPPRDPELRWSAHARPALLLTAAAGAGPLLASLGAPAGFARLAVCLAPAAALSWLGLFACAAALAYERGGERAEAGRLLTTNLAGLAAVASVLGSGVWVASLIL